MTDQDLKLAMIEVKIEKAIQKAQELGYTITESSWVNKTSKTCCAIGSFGVVADDELKKGKNNKKYHEHPQTIAQWVLNVENFWIQDFVLGFDGVVYPNSFNLRDEAFKLGQKFRTKYIKYVR